MHAEPTQTPTAPPARRSGAPELPELPAGHVPRPRLTDRLARAGSVPLVLVSGAAGTGKTTLTAEWLRQAEAGTVAWAGLDERAPGFWGPVLGALARLGLDTPRWGRDPDAALGRDRLRRLAGRVAAAPRRLTVVLDGYELVSAGLAREVDYLVRHSAGRLCLVLVGRVDPVLPLYRYRLADTLVEVRMADLAFTDPEATALLHRAGVQVPADVVHDLNQRLRGWAAGLRFAARALAGRDDAASAAAAVAAQAGDVREYLLGEVLDVQRPEVRRALLDTSVADVLEPGLVEELAGAPAVRALGEPARSNAFVEPVPDRTGVYRYYPFFRDLLRAQLAYESPEAFRDLHRRAAAWYDRHGQADRAVGHLARIGAWDEVAQRIVDGLMVGRILLEGPGSPLRGLARRLPDRPDHPPTCVVRAAVALAEGDRTVCAEELAAARKAPAPRNEMLQVSLLALDAVRASSAADADTAATLARRATQALRSRGPAAHPGHGPQLDALVRLSLGIALLRRGSLRAARDVLARTAGLDVARAHPRFRADCLGYLALTETLEGHPSSARRTANEAVEITADTEGAHCAPAVLVALAVAALEQYEIEAARAYADAATACGQLREDPVSRGLTAGVLAGLERADGDLPGALSRLDAAATELRPTDPWLADHLRVVAAELSVASGRAELALEALDAVVEREEPAVAVVAAAAYAEQGQDEAVGSLLATVRDGEPGLRARVSELLLEGALDRSLRLAEPEGLRRPFREAGPAVQRALAADARLLLENRWLHPSDEVPTVESAGIVEPLTPRELEVLGHLQELLTTEEIAEKMFVSVNTVRTHVRSILRKLGVSRRNAAVRKARELGMVGG